MLLSLTKKSASHPQRGPLSAKKLTPLISGALAQGSARVIRCLQDAREELSYECRATLFDAEVRMAEDIDFKYPMKRACTAEIQAFCSGIQHGQARVIRCLQVCAHSFPFLSLPFFLLACMQLRSTW